MTITFTNKRGTIHGTATLYNKSAGDVVNEPSPFGRYDISRTLTAKDIQRAEKKQVQFFRAIKATKFITSII